MKRDPINIARYIKALGYVCLFGLISCQSKTPSQMQDDQKLFQAGMSYFDKGKFLLARDHFSEIKKRFPESPFQKKAHLRLADSYFNLKELIDAEIEYFEFTNLYPLNEDIAHAWYQKGLAQYRQAPKSAQKNLAPVMAAKATFIKVRNQWPESDEAEQADAMIEKCAAKEVEKELYLAKFYYRTKRYPQAIHKLEMLSLEGSKRSEWVGQRNILMAKSYGKTNQTLKAKRILQTILETPDLKAFHAESQRYLRRLE